MANIVLTKPFKIKKTYKVCNLESFLCVKESNAGNSHASVPYLVLTGTSEDQAQN